MKKLFLIFPVIFLSGCAGSVFYPYEGTKNITGEGGFVERYISSKQAAPSVFDKNSNYKYDAVAFYISGLPKNEKCTLLGYIADRSFIKIAKTTLELNGNVATKSTVLFPVKFDNNSGILDGTKSADDWYNGYGEEVAKGYNIFECK